MKPSEMILDDSTCSTCPNRTTCPSRPSVTTHEHSIVAARPHGLQLIPAIERRAAASQLSGSPRESVTKLTA